MTSESKGLVFVTGASGFVGSHIVAQLLVEGYQVKIAARGPKVQILQESIAKASPGKVEVVEVKDIATDDLSSILKGVTAIIHVAAPLAGHAPPDQILDSAVEGTLNVLRQAVKAGIKKVVCTSSSSTTSKLDTSQTWTGEVFSEKDWGECTAEEVVGAQVPLFIYIGSKTLAEKAAWKYAEENGLNFTTINPPFIYGPFATQFPAPGLASLGTNSFIYGLIAGEKGRALPLQLPPSFCDVRDVALAHVRALEVGPIAGQRKRFLIAGGAFTWKEAVEYLSTAKPELASRLPSTENAPALPGKISTFDTKLAAELLKTREYISWQKCVADTIDVLVEAEKGWSV